MAEYFHLAESQIISLLLKENSDKDLFFSKVVPGVFPSNVGRSLFIQIRKFHLDGESWDDDKLILTCRIVGLTKKVLSEIRDEDSTWDNLDLYLDALRYHKAGSLLKHEISRITEDKKSNFNRKDIEAIKKVVDEAIYNIRTDEAPEDIVESSNFGSRIDDLFKENSESSKGALNSFGCDILDAVLTKGAKKGYVTTFFGPTGNGKSVFTLHLFLGRVNKGLPTILISTENDMNLLLERIIGSESGIPVDELQKPDHLSLSDQKKVSVLKEKYESKANFGLHYKPGLTMDKVSEIVKAFEVKTGLRNTVVFIDLFTMIKEIKQARTPKDMEAVMDDLHVLSNELQVHFVIVLQSRRRSINKENAKIGIQDLMRYSPSIDEIKNSGAFGERSRAVLSIFNPRTTALGIMPEMKEEILSTIPNTLEVCVVKQNSGEIGEIIKYALEGEISRLTPYFDDTY